MQVIPFTTLSSAVEGDAPPTEFRIFTAGKVETTKGTFTFDAAAAKSVMAEYAAHGADLMIDYDHASLADASIDPALAGKAAGWFDLELRNGELWAVNVRWTPAADAALRAKEWRYTSPAFALDKGRVTRLLNVAITNLPATRRLDPLMAASAGKKTIMASDSGLSPKLVSAALAAVASKDAKGSLGVLQQILAALLGGSSDEAPPSSADAPADAPSGDAPDATAAASAARDAEVASLAGAGRVAMALTGKTDPAEALAELTRRSKVAVELENREIALSAIRKTDEAAERRTLVASLIKLGVEIPATAWSDPAGSVPVERLNSEPIADMRARVETLNTARGYARVTTPTPPGGSQASFGLTAEQLQICNEMKVDPETFAKLAAQRDAAKTGRN